MATKKQLPKKSTKAAKSVKKAVDKKLAAKKPARASAKKPAPKKVAAAKKTVKKAAPKKIAKKAMPVNKTVSVAKKPSLPVKKPLPVKANAVKETVQPVKKPAVVAPTHHAVKPAIKPLVKPVHENEPPKKIVIPKTSTTKAVKYDPDFTKSVLDSPQQQEQTGPTMRYSDAELVEFKELILKKLETAKKELAYLQGLITRKDEGDMEDGRYMTMEDGSMSMEREQLSQMASRQITFIDHLEKALMRIENKTYGICRVTGKLIEKARLRAVPHATLSIEAKQMMNK